MMHAKEARDVVRELLEAELPRRWAHTQGVAAQAKSLAGRFGEDAELLEVAAWLHDIGYAPRVVATGFHPLDGARYLRDKLQADDLLCRLVAYHTGAVMEAEERGIVGLTDEFSPPPAVLLDALIYCDMTAGVDGRPVDVDDRLAEILDRYPADHVVHRAITRSAPMLRAATRSVQSKYGEGARSR